MHRNLHVCFISLMHAWCNSSRLWLTLGCGDSTHPPTHPATHMAVGPGCCELAYTQGVRKVVKGNSRGLMTHALR
eukprot:360976-Chlamydomonas_euryale.AAC.5